MMGVGAKRAIGLYRSCAPRQPIATYSAFWFAWAAFNRDTEIYSPS